MLKVYAQPYIYADKEDAVLYISASDTTEQITVEIDDNIDTLTDDDFTNNLAIYTITTSWSDSVDWTVSQGSVSISGTIYDGVRAELIYMLETMLGDIQMLPVFGDIPIKIGENQNGTTITEILQLSNNNIIPDDVSITADDNEINVCTYIFDYGEGYLYRIYDGSDSDNIGEMRIDYKFSYFSRDEINTMLDIAVDRYNAYPPISEYTLTTLPEAARGVIILEAYALCLQRILMEINTWTRRFVFVNATELSGQIQGIISQVQTQLNTFYSSQKGRVRTPIGITTPSRGITPTTSYMRTIQLLNLYRISL